MYHVLSYLYLKVSTDKQAGKGFQRNKIKKDKINKSCLNLLAYLDSNQDKQNQNLSYYHYTIGHRFNAKTPKRDAKIRSGSRRSKRKLNRHRPALNFFLSDSIPKQRGPI